jgi:hypothetical protein
MHDSQPQQTLADFLRDHCRSIIGHQRTRQTSLLNRLRESMHQVFSGL